jgi:hypothetical protein
MKTVFVTAFLSLVALTLAACGAPTKNTTPDKNHPSSQQTAIPNGDDLLALDNKLAEAYFKGDAKVFKAMLSDKLVMHEGGQRMDKQAVLKIIAGNKCDLRAWKLDEPQMSRIDDDTYVLSYKGTFDGSCAGADGPIKIPSPTRAATVWVRSNDKWLAAYHGENLIIDPKNPPPARPGSEMHVQKNDGKAAARRPADANITAAMLAVEQKIWEAWMAKDGKKLEALTTNDLSFQNIFGTHFANKAETIKDWTGSTCDVTSVSVADGAGSLISPTVGILTSKGTALGSCGGQKPTKIRVYGTSVYVKDGDSWKLAFCLNRPLD